VYILFIEYCYMTQEVLLGQSLLKQKYGNLCPECGGKLQEKLRANYQTLPMEARPFAWGSFKETCRQCKKQLLVDVSETLRQPVTPISQSGASALKSRHVQKRAMDLHHLRDPSVLSPEPRPSKRKRPRNPPRPVATPSGSLL